MSLNLLLVDDQPDVLEGLKLALSRTEHNLIPASSGEEAISLLDDEEIDVVVTDLKMGKVDGLEVLRHASGLNPSPAVILISAHGTIETAVEALKEGAYDFLTKPVNVSELRSRIEKAGQHRTLVRENLELRQQIDKRYGMEGMIGETSEIQQIYDLVRLVAPTKAGVLVLGESGTGKELLARAIHQLSPRAKKPFVAVHCAALPENLLESELFGHEKGAFTGAVARRVGRFELASGGTLFLDEIGEIPLSMQVKLLRVLEQREIQRVGGTDTIKVDTRIVAATNRDLSEEVAEGRFREDLYYRLNVVSITLPPLRLRRGDIPILTKHFLKEFARENNRPIPEISKEALDKLTTYHWPGNIRELRNVLENTIIFLQDKEVKASDLPTHLSNEEVITDTIPVPMGWSLEKVEHTYIKQVLNHCDGNRTKAAEVLGISRRTLQRRIKELGLESG